MRKAILVLALLATAVVAESAGARSSATFTYCTDPTFPRNAVYARAEWEHLDFEAQPARNRATVDGRGFLGLFGKKRTLRAGATLDVLIMRPAFIGKVVRYKIRNNKSVKRSELCLRPGSTTPRRSCS